MMERVVRDRSRLQCGAGSRWPASSQGGRSASSTRRACRRGWRPADVARCRWPGVAATVAAVQRFLARVDDGRPFRVVAAATSAVRDAPQCASTDRPAASRRRHRGRGARVGGRSAPRRHRRAEQPSMPRCGGGGSGRRQPAAHHGPRRRDRAGGEPAAGRGARHPSVPAPRPSRRLGDRRAAPPRARALATPCGRRQARRPAGRTRRHRAHAGPRVPAGRPRAANRDPRPRRSTGRR